MILWLLYPLHGRLPLFNVFRYITFRAANAALMALLLSIFLGPALIRWLRAKQIGQSIREEGPIGHQVKAGTPTMGGVLINLAIVVPTLVFADLSNRYVWVALVATVLAMLIGLGDDWRKVSRRSNRGLSGRQKLALQTAIGLGVAWASVKLFEARADATHIALPFLKNVHPDLGLFYVLLVTVVVVGSSNAVNLTDGLDGLAIGATLVASATFAILAYIAGNAKAAGYLLVPSVPGTGELAVFCAAIVGASLGFLWFNSPSSRGLHGRYGLARARGRARNGRRAHQAGDPARPRGRSLRRRGRLRDPAGRLVQAAWQAHLQDGAAPPPLRARRMAGVEGHHPVLDRGDPLRALRAFHVEAPMTLSLGPDLPEIRSAAVFGLARSGRAAVAALAEHGVEVTGTDLKADLEGLAERPGVRYVLGGHPESLLDGIDLVVVSPGIPLALPVFDAARARAVPVVAEIELASRLLPGVVVGVTGTNGKSTTTALAAALLKSAGHYAVACGNFGTPWIHFATREGANGGTAPRTWVVELSSFQLEGIRRFAPDVAVHLNLTPDHLDRYRSMDDYGAAKARIFENQREAQVAVLNADDPLVARVRPRARRLAFSRRHSPGLGAWLADDLFLADVTGKGPRIVAKRSDLALPGAAQRRERARRSRRDAAARRHARGRRRDAAHVSRSAASHGARAHGERRRLLERLEGHERGRDAEEPRGIRGPQGAPHPRREGQGRRLRAARPARGAEVPGGFSPSARRRRRSRRRSERLPGVALEVVGTLEKAIEDAASHAEPGDAVLLSPACASFDQFRDFEHRGEVFESLVKALLERAAAGRR